MQTAKWGVADSALDFTGASGKEWHLVLDRALGPQPAKSAVWLVRDRDNPSRTYAAKSQTARDVATLVDDAAIWRASCVASGSAPVVELLDVFVDRSAGVLQQVIFVQEYCSRGHIPRGRKVTEKALLGLLLDVLDVVEAVAEASAHQGAPRAHGNIGYDSVLVTGDGSVRVGGFGARRVAVLRDNPDLSIADDIFDVGLMLYSIMFGKTPSAPPYAVFPESTSPYGEALLMILKEILAPADDASLTPPTISRIKHLAASGGGIARSPVVSPATSSLASGPLTNVTPGVDTQPSVEAVERAVTKMTEGTDVAGAYSAILSATQCLRHAACDAIYSALFRCPISRDPIIAFRAVAMIHNLMLDGPDDVLDAVRRNDRFMEWTESSWTRNAAHAKSDPRAESSHASSFCFAGGEIAYFASFLRKKAKFHMLAAGGFTGGWQRTGALNDEKVDVIATRRRKVIGGMADLVEMAAELAANLARATDVEAAVKHAGIRSLVDECGRAHEAAIAIAEECNTVASVEKLVQGYSRLWNAAKNAIVAVCAVPAAGGAAWEEFLAGDCPRDLVAEADLRLQDEVIPDMNELENLPDGAWEGGLEESKEEKAERKAREKEERRAKRKAERAAARAAEEAKKAELTAGDGAVVVHGAGDAAAASVATMFGDLLAIDGDQNANKGNSLSVQDSRPVDGLSDAAALASAFGVPSAVVDGQYLALPAPRDCGDGFGSQAGDDYGDDEDGGYESYRAREEERMTRQEQQRREASTGAWAARAGYGGMALVATAGLQNVIPNKAHPVFCQCAHCQQAEAEDAAARAAERAQDGFSDDGVNHGMEDYSDRKQYLQRDKYAERNRKSTRSCDSLSDGQYNGRDSAEESYQSVEYELDNKEDAGFNRSDISRSAISNGNHASPTEFRKSEDLLVGQNGLPLKASVNTSNGKDPAKISSFHDFELPSEVLLDKKRLRLGDKIGEGSFAVVYKGEYKRQVVAIKKMHKQLHKSRNAVDEFCGEVQLMCRFRHPNLLCCIAASLKPPDILLITEFMQRGTLFDVLHRDKIRLTWALIRKISLQMAAGIVFLHENDVLHRDLKSSNLLVDGSYNVKLGDFGLSRPTSSVDHVHGLTGTYQYMAPEILAGEPQSMKSDVYAFGLVVWEMVSGEPPFLGMDPVEAGRLVLQEGLRPTIPPHCLRSYAALMQSCWATAPGARPTMPDVVRTIETTTK